jgi:hypothetical protein
LDYIQKRKSGSEILQVTDGELALLKEPSISQWREATKECQRILKEVGVENSENFELKCFKYLQRKDSTVFQTILGPIKTRMASSAKQQQPPKSREEMLAELKQSLSGNAAASEEHPSEDLGESESHPATPLDEDSPAEEETSGHNGERSAPAVAPMNSPAKAAKPAASAAVKPSPPKGGLDFH